MPFIAAVSKTDLPYKTDQQEVKHYARQLFSSDFPHADRLMEAFDNTEIRQRNFCRPLDYYATLKTFEHRNNEFIATSLKYSVQAAHNCIAAAGVHKNEITDILFVSSTGLATPSMDALIINEMRLNQHINRTPIFGLGCGGGVSGVGKANAIAKGNPDAVVLLIAVELCSLTFLRNDYSKSNFIASSLFSDGIAAVIVKGDNHNQRSNLVSVVASGSKLYYDSLNIMGWEFLDEGFKVIFSKDIPAFIHKNVKHDAKAFLARHGLELGDIQNFVFHPGGKKVLAAYDEALGLKQHDLYNTREIMANYGNMSSVTVLYVLERFRRRFPN